MNGVLVQGWLYQDGLNPVAELDGAGVVVSRFVYGTRPNVPDYVIRGPDTLRIVADELGSVRQVVDVSTGAVVQELAYDAWGRVLVDTNPRWQPFGYAGGLYDPITGFVRFGARDYDAEVGRWTAKDPIGFHGLSANLFAYGFADPVNHLDPDGTLAGPLVGAIAGGVGGWISGGSFTSIVAGALAGATVGTVVPSGSFKAGVIAGGLGSLVGQWVGLAIECIFTSSLDRTVEVLSSDNVSLWAAAGAALGGGMAGVLSKPVAGGVASALGRAWGNTLAGPANAATMGEVAAPLWRVPSLVSVNWD